MQINVSNASFGEGEVARVCTMRQAAGHSIEDVHVLWLKNVL